MYFFIIIISNKMDLIRVKSVVVCSEKAIRCLSLFIHNNILLFLFSFSQQGHLSSRLRSSSMTDGVADPAQPPTPTVLVLFSSSLLLHSACAHFSFCLSVPYVFHSCGVSNTFGRFQNVPVVSKNLEYL